MPGLNLRSRFVVLVAGLAIAAIGLPLPTSAAALHAPAGAGALAAAPAPTGTFAPRFSANDNGAITIIGNELETCPASATDCLAARSAIKQINNNSFNMAFTDADNDPATFDSSSADLSLSAGSSVLWAGLYWGARLATGTGGAPGSADRATMLFKVPGGPSYVTERSAQEFGPITSSGNAYQEFADVTGLVRTAGSGTYWGANVAAATGADRYAGWSLVVVYRNPSLPVRNLTVFDGIANVGPGSPQTVGISGFVAPKSGPVDAQLGMVAYEGDIATSGDTATLNSTQLGTAVSPGTNFFDSADDFNGTYVTSRNPPDKNMFGFDIKQLGASGVIPNGATSATFSFTSTGDVYFPGVLTTAINLFAPDFSPSAKTAEDRSGHNPPVPGDTIRYTVNFVNAGQDAAVNSVATDTLPPNTTFVPGSLVVLTGANAGPKTDSAGDDQAEYIPATRTVRFRLGAGADAANGGTLDPNRFSSFSYEVTVDGQAGGTTLTNQATLSYATATTGIPLTYQTSATTTPVAELADLSIAKSLSPDSVLAGEPVTTTLTVTNHGPSTARNATLTDPLPAAMAATNVTSTTGTCTPPPGGSGTVSCSLGDLAAGATATVTIVASTDPASTDSSITNVATVMSDTPDPSMDDNVAAASVPMTQAADVVITKTASPDTVTPGGMVTFTLRAANRGPSLARNIVVTDTTGAPDTLALLDASAPGAGCTVDAGIATCSAPSLAPGDTLTVTVHGRFASGAASGTSVSDAAEVATSTENPDFSASHATATVTAVAPQADLAITKTAPAGSVAGQTLIYTLEVANNGPSDAAGVVVNDPVPGSVTVTSATSSVGTCTIGSTVRCDIGSLPFGSPPVTVTITADVGPGVAQGPLDNSATVSASTGDPDPSNNTATAAGRVSAEADLAVTKTAAPDPAVAGQPLSYTITIANNGPSSSRGVTLSDALPAAFPFVSATPAQGSCTPSSGTTLSCDLGDLAAGVAATVRVVVAVPADYAGSPVTETATASSSTPDPDPSNDTASLTTSAGVLADVSISKQAPALVVAGDSLDYTLTASNDGPSTATGVVITDPLPAGVRFVSATAPCTFAAGKVTCPVGTLGAGASRVVTITVAVDPGQADGNVIANTATISSATPDPERASNSAEADTTVTTRADLSIAKRATSGSGPPGSPQRFVISITNNGPSTARDVTFFDTFPIDAGVTSVTGASCTPVANHDAECRIDGGDLGPGQIATVTTDLVLASSDPSGTFGNTVVVASTTDDPDAANNTATAPVTVTRPVADLALAKSAVISPIVAGGTFRYQLQVTNQQFPGAGSDAPDVVVTDPLPPGLTATSVSATQGNCTIAARVVTCDLGTLAGPATSPLPLPVTITIDGTAASSLTGDVTNTATVTSGATDPNPGNESAATTTPVQRQADLSVTKHADTSPLVAGAPAIDTITVSNAGPADATGVVVTDHLPAGVTFTPSLSDSSCAASGQTVTCRPPAITAGQAAELTIAGLLDATSLATVLTDTAHVKSDVADTTPADNTASLTTDVTRLAALDLTDTSSSSTPSMGTSFSYMLALTDDGPSAAADPKITDVLPPGIQLIDIQPTGMTCRAVTGTRTVLTCTAPELAPSASTEVDLVVAVPDSEPAGPLTNTAIASSAAKDPAPAAATAADTAIVEEVADIRLTKTLLTRPVIAGNLVRYRLSVTDAGRGAAPDVTISDPLGPGIHLAGSTGNCAAVLQENHDVVQCQLGRIGAGQSASVVLTLRIAARLTGRLGNEAFAGSGALDFNSSDLQSTATGTITQAPPSSPPLPVVPVTGLVAGLWPRRRGGVRVHPVVHQPRAGH